MKINQVI